MKRQKEKEEEERKQKEKEEEERKQKEKEAKAKQEEEERLRKEAEAKAAAASFLPSNRSALARHQSGNSRKLWVSGSTAPSKLPIETSKSLRVSISTTSSWAMKSFQSFGSI